MFKNLKLISDTTFKLQPFDIVSATQRLASSCQNFATAPEYAKAISRRKTCKFADALMAALGNATTMCTEDTCALADLFMSDECAHKIPLVMAKAQ